VPLIALLVCWHSHLQHEVLHGHPTRIVWLNELLVFPSIGLWFPYGVFRDSHLEHHKDSALTIPIDDPESFYVTERQWQRMSETRKALLRFNNTVLGRFLIGPVLGTVVLYGGAVRKLASGDRSDLASWLLHGPGCALVIVWLALCGFPWWVYAASAYFGVSLIMMRSFAEHRPANGIAERICINEAEAPIGLLFLNNNLHAVHHAMPGMAWYELPAIYRANPDSYLKNNGHFLWRGYRDIVRRHFIVPKDDPVHPFYGRSETV